MLGNLLQPEINELNYRNRIGGACDLFLMRWIRRILRRSLKICPVEEEDVAIFRVMNREQASRSSAIFVLNIRKRCSKSASMSRRVRSFKACAPDDRTRLLEELPAEVTRRLLESLSPDELKTHLLGYPAGTIVAI